MKNSVFENVTPCSLVKTYFCGGGGGKVEIVYSFEKLINLKQITRRHKQEDSIWQRIVH
jgi:hypothetical protein